MTALLPPFRAAGRSRPIALVVPGSTLAEVRAPYAAVTGPTAGGGASIELASGGDRLVARYDGRAAWLEVTTGGRRTVHRSRRHGRPDGPVRELGLTLTGTHLTVLTRGPEPWTARSRVDLAGRVDTRSEAWLSGLRSDAPVAGRFGQLGLRDLRVVTGGPPGRVLLSATSAGPGFFDTAHASVWELDLATLGLTHLSDLFFRRPDRPGAYGDHATHLVRDGDAWLVATSTWGDFDPKRPAVGVTLARSTADLLQGVHLLDTEPLPLPVDGLGSVGTWDPQLVRTDDGWLVGFVSATEFFRFHPAVAAGPSLDALTLRGAATDLGQTEGTTLAHLGGEWRVLASDGDARRYPVFDLAMRETGTLDAPYGSNIPWPTLVRDGDGWLLVGFDGSTAGGPVTGYGTHGDVVLARSV
ncbi:hypothetical protein [Nocardioides sp.]|uniref:hypothetical protein n=1 Tax=Nocardioides sp. TaxID=35761 RepID=UPI0037850EE4